MKVLSQFNRLSLLCSLLFPLPLLAQGTNINQIAANAGSCSAAPSTYKEMPNCAERSGPEPTKTLQEKLKDAWEGFATKEENIMDGIYVKGTKTVKDETLYNNAALKQQFATSVTQAYEDYQNDFNCKNPQIIIKSSKRRLSEANTQAAAAATADLPVKPIYSYVANQAPIVTIPLSHSYTKDAHVTHEIPQSCGIPMEDAFANNSTELRPTAEVQSFKDKIDACIQDRTRKGFEFDGFEVVTSANYLANTGTAATTYGAHNFEDLSKARALHLREFLDTSYPQAQQVPTKLSYKGRNGDGTSGPCPYSKKANCQGENCYQLKQGLTQTRDELEKYKFATIIPKFKDKPVSSQTKYYKTQNTKIVTFECNRN